MDDLLRVLVVDGCQRARLGLRVLLKTTSVCRVVAEASVGQEALDVIPICRPDLIFLDLQLSGEDGLETMQTIKRRWPEIRIVILTLHTRRQPEALAAGADAFVSKLDGPTRILETLDGLIRSPHAAYLAS